MQSVRTEKDKRIVAGFEIYNKITNKLLRISQDVSNFLTYLNVQNWQAANSWNLSISTVIIYVVGYYLTPDKSNQEVQYLFH